MEEPLMRRSYGAQRSSGTVPSRVRVSFLLLVLGLLEGCAVFGGSPSRVGGSGLKEGAEEAKKKPEEKHKRLVAGEKVDEPITVTEIESEPPPPPAESRPEPPRSSSGSPSDTSNLAYASSAEQAASMPPAPHAGPLRSRYRRVHVG